MMEMGHVHMVRVLLEESQVPLQMEQPGHLSLMWSSWLTAQLLV